MAMSWNGAQTGMVLIQVMRLIGKVRTVENSGCSVGALGSATAGACVLRSVIATRLAAATAVLAFGWPEVRKKRRSRQARKEESKLQAALLKQKCKRMIPKHFLTQAIKPPCAINL